MARATGGQGTHHHPQVATLAALAGFDPCALRMNLQTLDLEPRVFTVTTARTLLLSGMSCSNPAERDVGMLIGPAAGSAAADRLIG
eukprot:COSAG01_NODE_7111_length_3346_cov_78.626116_6_plen_86_part_00